MTGVVEVLARAAATTLGQYQPIRSTSLFGFDEPPVFGFVPIKLVSEEVIQAIAFGDIDGRPTVVTRWNAMSRDARAFEFFASGLDQHITAAISSNRLPRIWLPHEGALRQLDLLGHRYRTNKTATDSLRRMGAQCRSLMEEYQHKGQQVVAVASELLRAHVVTGQSPSEDAHLGAFLAWFENAGRDPAQEATKRSLIPAAAMLTRREDDEVEALRRVAKKGGATGSRAQTQIERILTIAALREWDLLSRARSAFWALGMSPLPGIADLRFASRERIYYSLPKLPSPPSRTAALARLLDALEASAERTENADVEGDRQTLELLRRKGRVVNAVVKSIDQPRRGCYPCCLRLFTQQLVLRIRTGTKLRLVGSKVSARVTTVQTTFGGHCIVADVIAGVRSRPGVGAAGNWTDSAPFEANYLRQRVYETAKVAAPAAFAGTSLPARRGRAISEDLIVTVNRLRR